MNTSVLRIASCPFWLFFTSKGVSAKPPLPSISPTWQRNRALQPSFVTSTHKVRRPFTFESNLKSGQAPKSSSRGGKHLTQDIKETDYEGLDLLPSDISYRHFSLALDKVKRSKQRLQESLAPLRALYTYIVLDCPPTLSLLTESILTAADILLIPVVPTTLSMRAYAQLLSFVYDHHYSDRPIHAFFSMVERSKTLHRAVMQETLGHDHRFLQSCIPYAADIEKMGLRREPVGAFAPHSPAASAYAALWQEVQAGLKLTTPHLVETESL